MLKPSFRFFIIPLGAICTLASLSAQNAAPRAQRDSGSMLVRQPKSLRRMFDEVGRKFQRD